MDNEIDYEFWLTYTSDKLNKIKKIINKCLIISSVLMVENLLILILLILIHLKI